MKKINNKRVMFALPEGTTITEVIFGILESNGLKESNEEVLNKSADGKDSKLIIVRDAAITIVEKKIPEKKLIELLQKHLATSQETAEKIVYDINQKLVPFAKIIDLEKNSKIEDQKEKFREELLKKINSNRNTPVKDKEVPLSPYSKKLDITNVEENAEKMQKEGKNSMTEEKNKFPKKNEENRKLPTQNIEADVYREPIE